MIKKIFSLIIIAVATFVMVACSNKVDTDRIMQYTNEPEKELTENDFDFLIDQMEEIKNMTKGMDKEQANEFYRNLPEDQRNAIVVVNLLLMSSDDKLTDEQKQRLLSFE